MSIYDAEAPQGTGGNFLKFVNGSSHRIRMFGDPVAYMDVFPSDPEPKQQFASLCLWANPESKKWEAKVFVFGWMIQKSLKAFAKDEDWGDPTGYDIEVQATGDKLERKYQLVPKPKKDLTKEQDGLISGCTLSLSDVTKGKTLGIGSSQPEAQEYDPFADKE